MLRIRVTLSPRCLALHVFKPFTSIVFTTQSSILQHLIFLNQWLILHQI